MMVHGPARSVEEVMGRLFDKPHKRQGYLQKAGGRRGGASRASRAVQTARGVPSAFFKNIRGAGTANRAGLNGQMEYILNQEKVSYVFDSQCRYDRAGTLERSEMLALTREWEKTWRYGTKLGNTTHMVMSFPKGTDPLSVMEITRSVCEEKLQGVDGIYDYLATVHTDTEHPHTHVIVNRFQEEGGLFTLRKDGPHSFQAFKECIAAHALSHGIELSTATRFEQGKIDRPASHEAVQQARREGLPLPPDRVREGYDLEYARERIDEAALIYAATSMLAANFGLEKIEAICVKATLALEDGEVLEGDFSMIEETKTEAERFDHAVEGLNESIERMREQIATVSDAERPTIEREYVGILKDLRDAAPDTLQGERLGQEASNMTPYHEAFIVDKTVLSHPQFGQILEDRLSGSGISVDEMRARLMTGADNDQLASIWTDRDMERIAEAKGLDLDSDADRQVIERELTDVYEELRLDLLQYRAASVAPEFRELARTAERQEPGVYPPYAALRSPAELQAAYATLKGTIDGDPRDPEAIKAYLADTTPELNPDERERLAEDLSGMVQAAEFRQEQQTLREELHKANVAPDLITAALSVHRDGTTDDTYKPTVPGDFVRGLGRELRDELQIDKPTVEDFNAHIKNEAPLLREETREDLARRLHAATYLRVEAITRDDRQPFTERDTNKVVRDLDRNLASGIRPSDEAVRADVAKVVRESLDKEELERLERGDTQALGKLSANPATQKVMAFEYLRSQVATGRHDLVQQMQRINSEAQQSLNQKTQHIDSSSQKMN